MAEWCRIRLYRLHPENGHAQDWAITHDAQSVQVYYGRADGAWRSMTIPLAQCQSQSPEQEVQQLVRRKIAEGYTDLGAYELNRENRRQRRSMNPAEAVTQSVDRIPRSLQAQRVTASAVDTDWFF